MKLRTVCGPEPMPAALTAIRLRLQHAHRKTGHPPSVITAKERKTLERYYHCGPEQVILYDSTPLSVGELHA